MKGINTGGGQMTNLLATLIEAQKSQSQTSQSLGTGASKTNASDSSPSFADELARGIKDINNKQVSADRLAIELSSGRTGNIHETMLASTQAELSFNLMVQVRNKALEAYTEIMRMQV